MVKFKHILTFVALAPLFGFAQPMLTLDSCINQANRNFAFAQQITYAQDATNATVAGIKKNYLPTLDFNAAATYQNEQISIPVAFPGFEAPVAPLNINNALFSLRQWIYDGNITQHQRLIKEAEGNVQLQQIEVQKLELKNSVMQLFFAALLQNKQLEVLQYKAEVLDARLKEVATAVEAHVLLASNADMLQAEKIQLSQRITELEFGIKSAISGLSQLMGTPLPQNIELIEPQATITTTTDVGMRPDIVLLNYQMQVLDAQQAQLKSNYLPKIGAFADGGFGYPGYNIFKDEIAPMAKVGVSLQWRLFDWNKSSNQRQALQLQQKILGLNQNRLKTQIEVQREAQKNQIAKAQALKATDSQLVALYDGIAETYATQLANGTITSADYLAQLNKAQEARTNLALHQLQWLIAVNNYNTIVNGE